MRDGVRDGERIWKRKREKRERRGGEEGEKRERKESKVANKKLREGEGGGMRVGTSAEETEAASPAPPHLLEQALPGLGEQKT